jgi:RHS repeat-associated protein
VGDCADQNRVAKTVNGVTTQYLVEDDVNPTGLPQVVEETVNGAVTRSYTYGLERISQAQPIQGAWAPSFYEYDGAGSVRKLTNLAANGTVTDTYEYDAFGNAVNKTGATPNNYLYRGEQFDPDLGLYYLRARYYNPATGRFLSVDPLADEGQRRYEYAAANPVDGMDPNGSEDLIEYALVPHIFPPLWIPNWCGLSGTNPMGGLLPCIHRPPHRCPVNLAAFANALTQGTNGATTSGHQCSNAVYTALGTAGANFGGHPVSSGKNFGSLMTLPGVGFAQLSPTPPDNYSPAIGDVAIFQSLAPHAAIPNGRAGTKGSPSGHVEGYNGSIWVSDFLQKNNWNGMNNGFWPGSWWKAEGVSYAIYRCVSKSN